jgi:heme/copper-type cytochrome/quinol oxidase subunit 2
MRKFVMLVLAMFTSLSTWAQCAMCKATAESGQAAGSTEASGLNSGILYLMVFPYLIMAAVGIAWYRSQKKKSATL